MFYSRLRNCFFSITLLCSFTYAQSDSSLTDLRSLENMLNQQVHSASRYWQYISDIPLSVSVITRKEIDLWGCSTLSEVLAKVRSFYLTYDGNYTYLGVRGFSRPGDYNNRILVTINGHSLNENIYDGVYIGPEFGYPIDMIERIEIVRGPGSSVYGASAVFAVINIITRSGGEVSGGNVQSVFESPGKMYYSASYGERITQNLEAFISLGRYQSPGREYFFSEFNTPADNNGRTHREMDKETADGAFLMLKYKSLTLQAGGSTRLKNVPTASYNTIFNDPALTTQDDRFFSELQFDDYVSENIQLSSRLAFDNYFFRGNYPYLDNNIRTLNTEKSLGQWMLFDNQVQWDFSEISSLLAGAEVQRHANALYEFGYDNLVSFRINSPLWLTSFYLQSDNHILNDLTISLGGRVDKYSSLSAELSPRVGIIYNLTTAQTFKLLFGKTFRRPNLYETYYEDPATNFVRSQGLTPERIRSYEFVFQNRFYADAILSLSAYYNEMRYLIDVMEDANSGEQMYKNSGNINSYGLELVFDAKITTGWRTFVTGGIYSTREEGSKEVITNSPGSVFKWNVSYTPSATNRFVLNGYFETGRKMWNGFTTSSALIHDLGAITDLFSGKFNVSVFVKNIFDVPVHHPTGNELSMPSLQQPGRTLMFKGSYVIR